MDLEEDLRNSEYIVEKARSSQSYAQNIYAAMSNMRWCKITGDSAEDTLAILKEDLWSCSWRSAGRIVSNIIGQGDYLDWYCSGIGDTDIGYGLSADKGIGYVPEGEVTEEIANDFKQLGWVPIPWDD
jgi:hypothetical protein